VERCGEYYVLPQRVLVGLGDVLAELCLAVRSVDVREAMACFDMFDTVNAAIISFARGSLALGAMAVRRLLEEVTNLVVENPSGRPYRDIPRVYEALLKGLVVDHELKETIRALEKLLRSMYGFLSGFTHPRGEGFMPYLGIWMKPPVIEVNPQSCMNIARPLLASVASLLFALTPYIVDRARRNGKEELLMELKDLLDDLEELPFQEPLDAVRTLEAVVELLSHVFFG